MTGNNPKLDLVNVDVQTNFGQILSNRSQNIERKQNSDVNQGPLLCQNLTLIFMRLGRTTNFSDSTENMENIIIQTRHIFSHECKLLLVCLICGLVGITVCAA